MGQLRAELSQSTELSNVHIPSKGDLCAALFRDGLWLVMYIQSFILSLTII